MSERVDPENDSSTERLKLFARVVEVINDELDKAKVPETRVAKLWGFGRTQVARKLARVSILRDDEGEKRPHPWAAEISMLPVEVMIKVVNRVYLEPHGYAAVKLPGATKSMSNLALVASMHRESSEATSAAFTAIASGHMDRAKALNAIKESRESIAVSLEFIALAESALREGVVAFGSEVA